MYELTDTIVAVSSPTCDKRVIIRMAEDTPATIELSYTQEQIINTIKRYPGINQKELIRLTGISRLTLTNNLNKLMDLCVVRRLSGTSNVCYEYIDNGQLSFEILKRLVVKLLRKEITEREFLELKRKLE